MKRKLKILFVLPSLKRAGAESQLVHMVCGMDRDLFEPHVFSFEQNLDQLDVLKENNVPHHHYRRQSKYDFEYTKIMAELIDELEIDVIHGSLQFAVLAGWLAKRRSHRRPPLVAAIHTTVNLSLKEELQDRLLYRWLLKSCAAIIFVCEAQHQYWIKRYPGLSKLSHTVYNGVDPEYFRRSEELDNKADLLLEQLGIDKNNRIITLVAGFRPEKQHALLVAAFEKVPENVHLMFAGDGQTRTEIEEKVHKLGLSERVHFLGLVSDIRPVLAASTATVLASTAVETFSMAVLESMSMEVPVIVPDLSGLPEAVEDGETGFVYRTGDLDALTQVLLKFSALSDSQTRAMGKAARKRLRGNFTESMMVDKTQLLLQSAAEN